MAAVIVVATPNFNEAETRSKISRMKAEARYTAKALEAYKIDNKAYPPAAEYPYAGFSNGTYQNYYSARVSSWLTTPVSYINHLANDVFVPPASYSANRKHWYRLIYYNYDEIVNGAANPSATTKARSDITGGWVVYSYGPDKAVNQHVESSTTQDTFNGVYLRYDPTNGLISKGNILRTAASDSGFIPGHPLVVSAPKGPN